MPGPPARQPRWGGVPVCKTALSRCGARTRGATASGVGPDALKDASACRHRHQRAGVGPREKVKKERHLMAWPAEAHYSTVSPPLRSAARGMAFVGASLVETLQVRASVQRDDCAYTFLNDGERT